MPAPVSSLIPVADALTARDVRAGQELPVSVWDVLTTLEDHRGRRGRRHELATVLLVALAAVLAGARSLAGIAGWAADLPRWTWPRLGIDRRPPSLSTIRRILVRVDPDVLDAVLHAWLATLTPTAEGPESLRAVAVDGKTCRGARTSDENRVHLFSAVDRATGLPLGQVLAETKGHEITAFATLLDRIDLTGVVVTADALHTQRQHAHYLHRHGGEYVFIAKRNQPKLHDRLAGLPWPQVPVAHHDEEKGHGRRESRTLKVTAVAAGIGFPHARLAACIVRTRSHVTTGRVSSETVYAITSLTWDEVTPEQLARLVRGHWSIRGHLPLAGANRVHYVRDVTFDRGRLPLAGADRSQVRTGQAPRVMAGLRNVAIGLIRARTSGSDIAAMTRTLGRRIERLLGMLDHGLVTPVTGASTLN